MELMNTIMLWCVIAMAVYSIWYTRKKPTKSEETIPKMELKKTWYIGAGVIVIACVILSRIVGWGSLPSWIGVDEAGIAYDAYSIANFGTDRYEQPFPVYMVNFGGGQSALYTYIAALAVKTFGFSIATIRLPALLFYIVSIACMGYLVVKQDNRIRAWLTMFLIVICPWHIMQSRYALDCNLLAPMMVWCMIGVLQSKKWWQYGLTGMVMGITLYTYSLAWLIMPVCLFVWIAYLLYTKKIQGKHIVVMGIPIGLLAVPLFLFLAVNNGLLPEIQTSWITIPALYEFRSGEIGIHNLIEIADNLKKMMVKGPLDPTDCFYYAQWLLAIIGIGITLAELVKHRKEKQFVFSHFILLTVLAIWIPLLFVSDMNTTKANALYIPILYFAAIGIQEICRHIKPLWIGMIVLHLVAFGVFEWYYFTSYNADGRHGYNDVYLYQISQDLETKFPEREVYVITYRLAQSYIYTAIANLISPAEYMNTREAVLIDLPNRDGYYLRIKGVSNYHFMEGGAAPKEQEIQKDAIYVVYKDSPDLIQLLHKKIGLQEIYNKEYFVFYQ